MASSSALVGRESSIIQYIDREAMARETWLLSQAVVALSRYRRYGFVMRPEEAIIDKPRAPGWLRVLRPVGLVLTVFEAASRLADGRVVNGAYWLGLSLLIGYFIWRERRQQSKPESRRDEAGLVVPTALQVLGFYCFFGGCVVSGVAIFVLDVLGTGRGGVVIGVIALVNAALGVYVLVRGTANLGRWR